LKIGCFLSDTMYKIMKNSYFSMSSDAQMEETTVPNREVAKQFIEKANAIKE